MNPFELFQNPTKKASVQYVMGTKEKRIVMKNLQELYIPGAFPSSKSKKKSKVRPNSNKDPERGQYPEKDPRTKP